MTHVTLSFHTYSTYSINGVFPKRSIGMIHGRLFSRWCKSSVFPFFDEGTNIYYKYVSAQSYDFIYVHVLIRSIKQLFKGDICAFFQNILGTLYLALKVL